jgi:multidrug efflux pump subunit AcrA (membrane-fusion protein)
METSFTRTLLTEIDVPNPDHALSPGVYCTVELKIPRKTPSLIVPSEAIVFNRDGLNVVVVENGVAHVHQGDRRTRLRHHRRGERRGQGWRPGDPQSAG